MPKINYDLKASAHVSCLQLIDENAKTQRAVQNFQCLNTSLPATSISLLLNRVLCVHLDRSLCLNCAKKYVTHLFIVLATMQIDMMVEKRRMDRKGMKKNKMSAGADVHVISWDLICPPFCSVCCRCCRPTGLFCCSLVSGETEIQIHGDLLPRPRHVSLLTANSYLFRELLSSKNHLVSHCAAREQRNLRSPTRLIGLRTVDCFWSTHPSFNTLFLSFNHHTSSDLQYLSTDIRTDFPRVRRVYTLPFKLRSPGSQKSKTQRTRVASRAGRTASVYSRVLDSYSTTCSAVDILRLFCLVKASPCVLRRASVRG